MNSILLHILYPLTFILPIAIIIVGTIAIFIDIIATRDYLAKSRPFVDNRLNGMLFRDGNKHKEYKLTEQLIEKLKKDKERTKIDRLADNEIKWLYKYIDGEPEGKSTFTPTKTGDGDYSILEYPTMLNRVVPRSPVAFVPTVLIASGVFSTFLGISEGAAGGGDSSKLVETGTKLFGSLQHVFFTSLLGLGFATVLMIVIAITSNIKEKHRNKLRKELNDIAVTLTSEKLLLRLDAMSGNNSGKDLGKVAESLSMLSAEAIGNAVAVAMNEQNKSLLTEIKKLQTIQEFQGKTVTELVSQLEHKFTQPVVARLERNAQLTQAVVEIVERLGSPFLGEIQKLQSIQESQGNTVTELVSQLEQKLIQPVVAQLEVSTEITKDASKAVRELKDEFGDISQSLSNAVGTIQEFQKETLTDLKEFANSLDTTLQKFQGETKGVLEQVGIEINRSVAQSIQGMEAQREAFRESAEQASTTFRGIREDLQSALTTQATEQRTMLTSITAQTKEILQEANSAFQAQSITLQTVGKEAADLMNTAKDNLKSTLLNIDTTLQNTRQTVQDELEKFRTEYQGSLNSFFEQQNDLLTETLGKQRAGLAEVVASLQQTFNDEAEKRQQMSQEVDTSMANILSTTKKVSELASALGLTSSERLGQLQELSRTIGGEAHRVEESYQNMTIQFEQALKMGNKELSDYLSNANESYRNYFKDFDLATSQAYKELNNTSGELLKAAQYLVFAADRQDTQGDN